VRAGPAKPFARQGDALYRFGMPQLTPTDRTRHRRLAERGSHELDLINTIIDEALICHVGFALDGRPVVIPTIHARVDDHLYLHGAPANHMLRSIAGGIETCVTITLVDGLVLARSAFHHSMNYRSVLIFGTAQRVDDADEKRHAFDALVEHVVPGRTADARPPNDAEMRKTLVVKLPITEASAKVRTGGPIDDEEDLALPIWAGVVPCATRFDTPRADEGVSLPAPEYARSYARPQSV
jgi:nitroimidazol reductase NimA-like FMN-containing flavoprotein (pyridoxamine 5'-phosphate oxidase superfamily)